MVSLRAKVINSLKVEIGEPFTRRGTQKFEIERIVQRNQRPTFFLLHLMLFFQTFGSSSSKTMRRTPAIGVSPLAQK